MISVMIAGSYTPVCLVVLHNTTGYALLALVWGIAVIGIIFKLCWVTCPRWISSSLYIIMGWACVLSFTQIINALPKAAFMWLLAGGIIYTMLVISTLVHMRYFIFLLWQEVYATLL